MTSQGLLVLAQTLNLLTGVEVTMPEENTNDVQGPPPFLFTTTDNEAKHMCKQSREYNLYMRSGICMVSKLQCGRKIVSDPLIDVVGVASNDGMNNRCSSRGGGGSIHGSCNSIIRYYSDARKLTVVAVRHYKLHTMVPIRKIGINIVRLRCVPRY